VYFRPIHVTEYRLIEYGVVTAVIQGIIKPRISDRQKIQRHCSRRCNSPTSISLNFEFVCDSPLFNLGLSGIPKLLFKL
jgi:hypothetical protein